MPMLMSTGCTENDSAICGSEVLMIAPSICWMKKAEATIKATRRALLSSGTRSAATASAMHRPSPLPRLACERRLDALDLRESCRRQRSLFHRGDRALELVERGETHQRRAHGRARDREARCQFGEARSKTLFDQRHEAARAGKIAVEAHGRTDRIGWRRRIRLPFGAAGQRAAGERADADHACAGRLRVLEHPLVVLC